MVWLEGCRTRSRCYQNMFMSPVLTFQGHVTSCFLKIYDTLFHWFMASRGATFLYIWEVTSSIWLWPRRAEASLFGEAWFVHTTPAQQVPLKCTSCRRCSRADSSVGFGWINNYNSSRQARGVDSVWQQHRPPASKPPPALDPQDVRYHSPDPHQRSLHPSRHVPLFFSSPLTRVIYFLSSSVWIFCPSSLV